jgi:riboflavin biosynthesis pyrimidine reductase
MAVVSENENASSTHVIANLVVANNGATTLAGRSRPLSSPSDRQRFHQIRSQVRAIAIGGNTYRSEPYGKTKLPILVATRQILPGGESDGLVHFLNYSPAEVIDIALSKYGEPVLVEGGVDFLRPLIVQRLFDTFYITRSRKSGDGNFLDPSLLKSNYELTDSERFEENEFEVWRPRMQQSI